MKTILFIEDESALQKTFSDMLLQEGYEIISAPDGQSGLRLAKTKKPDLILLDLILPEMHGFDVLKFLKQDTETKDIPVIVLTNLEQAEDIERVLAFGVTTYLVKSNYSLKEILGKIRQVLSPVSGEAGSKQGNNQ